jgi:hypothetical protein
VIGDINSVLYLRNLQIPTASRPNSDRNCLAKKVWRDSLESAHLKDVAVLNSSAGLYYYDQGCSRMVHGDVIALFWAPRS